MNKKVVIIGGGMSGLIAGCYLRMNGYPVEIHEMHSLPGGLCTSWDRKGYTINGCIHWLVGSSPGDNFYYLWNELVDLKSITFFDPEVYQTIEDKQGNAIRLFTQTDRLEKELLEKAPEDAGKIREMCRAVRKLTKLNMPNRKAPELLNAVDRLKFGVTLLPYLGIFGKYIRISAREFSHQFKNAEVRKLIEYMFLPEMSVLFLFFTLAWMNKKSAGYPIGGSLSFSRLFEARFRELGGEIHYSSRVKKILTSERDGRNCATGVELENGSVFPADIVISAGDGHAAIWEMLDGKFQDEATQSTYNDFVSFPSYLQVSLGIRSMPEVQDHSLLLPFPTPLKIDPETEQDYAHFLIYRHDPTLAPSGSILITSLFTTYNHAYWSDLRASDHTRYKEEKQNLAQSCIDLLKSRFGILDEQVEMIDVSSPATVIRYTNNWKGSFEGWLMTPKTGFRQIPKTLKGLNNFYMIGHWVEPGGGLPSCLLTGRNVTQLICKSDNRRFRSRIIY